MLISWFKCCLCLLYINMIMLWCPCAHNLLMYVLIVLMLNLCYVARLYFHILLFQSKSILRRRRWSPQLALFAFFKNIGETYHAEQILKINFAHKKINFQLKPFLAYKKHKKHGHPQNIAILTIFKNIGGIHLFNNIFKTYFIHIKSSLCF